MARIESIGRGRLVLFFGCLGLLAKSSVAAAAASDLQIYVQQCQTELGFVASDVPALNCNNGTRFVLQGGFINDFLVYKKINDSVDLTAACRWVDQGLPPTHAASIEMIIHNRKNGSTCFFSANNSNAASLNVRTVPVSIVSPTNFPAADTFWVQPRALNAAFLPIYVDELSPDDPGNTNALRCVGCHSQGPYIASIRIAPTLARFGLLNDRHDTRVNMTMSNHYHAVGSGPYNNQDPTKPFGGWDAIIYDNTHGGGCSTACHALAASSSSPTDSLSFLDTVTMLLPSITRDRNEINGANPSPMPPLNLASDYRWINLDTPGDGVETESYVDSLAASGTLVPGLLTGACAQPQIPTNLAAHAVGVDGVNSISGVIFQGGQFQSTDTGDYFRQFSLKDGLVCMNADQDPGRTCHDYDVSYLCKSDTWTPFYNSTVSNGGDDHEERSRVNAQVLAVCGSAPIAMQARTKLVYTSGTFSVALTGPGDRLARFSPYGLTCNNADQPDGTCSNYVVRYEGCVNPDQAVARVVQSTWSGKDLAATSSANNTAVKGQTSNGTNAQKWAVEPVANTEYVRLRNLSTNTYLNLTSQAEAATVVSSTSSTSTSQRWTAELVYGTNQYRLRNLWSGRYLTIASTSDGAALLSQAKNASWASQRWTLQ